MRGNYSVECEGFRVGEIGVFVRGDDFLALFYAFYDGLSARGQFPLAIV
jgi:hypothetical protein